MPHLPGRGAAGPGAAAGPAPLCLRPALPLPSFGKSHFTVSGIALALI